MQRIAHIEGGTIRNVSLADDDWTAPDDGSAMLESDALADGLQRYVPPHVLREQARQALRDLWTNLPAWIRGPYHASFTSAGQLLDSGDDEAAEALIRYAPPMPGFSADQLAEFSATREQLADAIADLNN